MNVSRLSSSPSPGLHSRAWNGTLPHDLYDLSDRAEHRLRDADDATGFERLESLRDLAVRGSFAGRAQWASNGLLAGGLLAGAVAGGAAVGVLGVVAGVFAAPLVVAELTALGIKALGEHRLRRFVTSVVDGTRSPEGPLPAQPTATAPPLAEVAPEDVRQALAERHPEEAERAAVAIGSERLRVLEDHVTRELLTDRGLLEDSRVHAIWRYPTDDHEAGDTCFDPGTGNVYTRVGKGHTTYLTALDSDGRVRWTWPEAATCSPVLDPAGNVYFRTRGALRVLNPLGQERWNAPVQANGSWQDAPPAVGPDGTVYVIDSLRPTGVHEPNLRLRALRDGREVWHFDATARYTGDPQVMVARDATIYLTAALPERNPFASKDEQDCLVALRPDGSLKSRAPVSFWPSYVATSLSEGPDGSIYACHGEKNLTAFTPEGRERWTYRMTDRRLTNHSSSHARLTQAPGFDSDGHLYVASEVCASYPEGYLVRLEPDGTERWVRAVDGGISSRPHVGSDGRIYLTSSSGELRGFDADGTQQVAARVGNASWSNFCFGRDGELLLNTDRQIVAWQPDDGKAVASVRRPPPSEPEVPRTATSTGIQDDGDTVVIGGIRLRKRS